MQLDDEKQYSDLMVLTLRSCYDLVTDVLSDLRTTMDDDPTYESNLLAAVKDIPTAELTTMSQNNLLAPCFYNMILALKKLPEADLLKLSFDDFSIDDYEVIIPYTLTNTDEDDYNIDAIKEKFPTLLSFTALSNNIYNALLELTHCQEELQNIKDTFDQQVAKLHSIAHVK